jgi:hypothetical protein
MTKHEIRMTNEMAMTNDEGPKGTHGGPFRRCLFVIHSSLSGELVLVLQRHFARRVSRPAAHPRYLPDRRRLPRGGSGDPPRTSLSGVVALVMLTAFALTAGCSGSGHKQTRRDVYMNLMTPLERSTFLFLEASDKPASIQMAYLQEIGVYQKWVEVPKSMQESVLRREVKEGMTPLHVQMAWGKPAEQREETLPAERAEGHTKTIWEYGLRAQKVGDSGYERSVCFFDDRVLWVRKSR